MITIPLNKVALYFKSTINVWEKSILYGLTEVTFEQDTYWEVYKEVPPSVVVINIENKKLQKISYELLGKILVTQTDQVFFVDKTKLPKTIVIKS
jgi:hypothetical protein